MNAITPRQSLNKAFRKIRPKRSEIKALVYKLYDLTYDKVLVVDEGFGMSREAYEWGIVSDKKS